MLALLWVPDEVLTDLSYPAIAREFGGRDIAENITGDKIAELMPERKQVFH